jgi:multidrug efflux pump
VKIDRARLAPGCDGGRIDNALYNAFGQRLISTIFTQSNQYRVVLEVDGLAYKPPHAGPVVRALPCQPARVRKFRCRRWPAHRKTRPAWWSTTWRSCLRPRCRSTPRRAWRWAMRWPAIKRRRAGRWACPPVIGNQFQGAALAFEASLANTLLLILAAVVTMYIVLGCCMKAPFTPSPFCPPCHRRRWVPCWRCWPRAWSWGMIAVIGIDFADWHRQEERDHDDRLCAGSGARQGLPPREAIFQACLLRFRPILMTTLAALAGCVATDVGARAWAASCASRWA